MIILFNKTLIIVKEISMSTIRIIIITIAIIFDITIILAMIEITIKSIKINIKNLLINLLSFNNNVYWKYFSSNIKTFLSTIIAKRFCYVNFDNVSTNLLSRKEKTKSKEKCISRTRIEKHFFKIVSAKISKHYNKLVF